MTIPEGYIREAAVAVVDKPIDDTSMAGLQHYADEYGFAISSPSKTLDPRETQRRVMKRAEWAVRALQERHGVMDQCTLYVSPDLTDAEVATAQRVVELAPDPAKEDEEPALRKKKRAVKVETVDDWTRRLAVWRKK